MDSNRKSGDCPPRSVAKKQREAVRAVPQGRTLAERPQVHKDLAARGVVEGLSFLQVGNKNLFDVEQGAVKGLENTEN